MSRNESSQNVVNASSVNPPRRRRSRKIWIIIGAVAIVLVVIVGFAYAANKPGAAPSPPSGPNVSIWDTGFCSNIGNCGYSPTSKNVTTGTTMTWTNTGGQPHTVTECTTSDSNNACPNGSGSNTSGSRSFDSNSQSTIGKNQQYQYVVNLNPGTYYYYCTIHPWMHGTILVSNA